MDNKQPQYIVYDPEKQTKEGGKSSSAHYDDEQYIDECDFGFANLKNSKVSALGKYDPKREHMVVIHGLNLKGKCSNTDCQAFKDQRTWIRKGYGEVQVSSVRFGNKCQGCQKVISSSSITSIGFTRAKVVIDGVMLQGQEEIEFHKEFEETEGKLMYFTDYDADIAKWGYLKIKTTKK